VREAILKELEEQGGDTWETVFVDGVEYDCNFFDRRMFNSTWKNGDCVIAVSVHPIKENGETDSSTIILKAVL